MNDLHALVQKPGEPLRKLMQRFSHLSHNIPEAPDAAIVTAFSANDRDMKMREKLTTYRVRTINEMYTVANKCARAEEGRLAPEKAKRAEEEPETSEKKEATTQAELAADVGRRTDPRGQGQEENQDRSRCRPTCRRRPMVPHP